MCAAIRQHRVRTLLEIGTSNGGTALLAARALGSDGLLVTVDIEETYDPERLRRAMGNQVRAAFVVADSHADSTVEQVAALGAGPYDMVFIDGDHSYDGVRRDTLAYGPCVRPGGIIGFHDVQRDQSEPIGSRSSELVGGVPIWWSQVSETALGGRWSFVDDPAQSGFGIGLIHLPSDEQDCTRQFDTWASQPAP
jgi:predicted O-methyltransferase YrrM